MKSIFIRTFVVTLGLSATFSSALAFDFYRQEINSYQQTINQPQSLRYNYYTQDLPAVTTNDNSNQANALVSFGNNKNVAQTEDSGVKSAKEFVNKFLPKNNGQWFLVAMIVIAMYLSSKFLIKSKKKEEKKPEEKKPVAKIA